MEEVAAVRLSRRAADDDGKTSIVVYIILVV